MEEYWIHTVLAIMVILNFFLSLTSVYLGQYKKRVFEGYLEHILEHICPLYKEEEEAPVSELAVKISKDKAQFDEWDNGD